MTVTTMKLVNSYNTDNREWDKTYLSMAKLMATHSKCASKQVACIIVRDNNILSIGLNGTISGDVNCNELYTHEDGENKVNSDKWLELYGGNSIPLAHREWSKMYEVHAEINAITKASKNNIGINGATAYTTHSPCNDCAKALISAGIKRVVSDKKFRESAMIEHAKTSDMVEFVIINEDNNEEDEYNPYNNLEKTDDEFNFNRRLERTDEINEIISKMQRDDGLSTAIESHLLAFIDTPVDKLPNITSTSEIVSEVLEHLLANVDFNTDRYYNNLRIRKLVLNLLVEGNTIEENEKEDIDNLLIHLLYGEKGLEVRRYEQS